MSATGRSGVRDPDDFYATPAWASLAICAELSTPSTIVDPGCGTGAIGAVARACWPDARIVGFEEHEGRALTALGTDAYSDVVRGDFLSFERGEHFDLALGNPPYELAPQFIERARAVATTVAFLLRVNYLGSQQRAAWHRSNPSDLLVLPRRPSFAKSVRCAGKIRCVWESLMSVTDAHPRECPGCGAKVSVCTSDATEYAWFVWGPGRNGRWKILDVSECEVGT